MSLLSTCSQHYADRGFCNEPIFLCNDIIPEDERFKLPNDFFLEEVVKSIVSYLKDAENEQAKETGSSCEKNCVQEFLKAEDLKEQCKIICEVLSDYKKRWYSEQPPK